MDPRIVEKYEIRKQIGRGRYGKVYLVEHKQLGEFRALKELRPETPIEKKRVEREIKLLQQAQHPHVIKIDEVFSSAEMTYICMEYASGGSLEKKIKHSISKKESIEITLDVLRGVQALHARGIIHRDLKPGNILFDSQKRAKIGDFGIATAHNVSVELTQQGKLLGTIGYMAPEQLLGRKDEIDEQSDIYAVGVMLYEMLIGQHPFKGKNHIETVSRSLQGKYVSQLKDFKIDDQLQGICYRAMSKEKSNRQNQVREMIEELSMYYIKNEYGNKKWITPAILKKSKQVLIGITSGICMVGVGLGVIQGENSVANIWQRKKKEYRELSVIEGNKYIKDIDTAQENIHRILYDAIQGESKANRTEEILKGERLYRLGLQCYEGRGVVRDYQKAHEYFKQASEYKSIEASLKLGSMYFNGKGVKKNEKKSMEYYRKVAEMGEPRGCYYVGKIYIDHNMLDEGREYLEKAALKNHHEAIEKLINMYTNNGDHEKILYYLKKGVEINNNYSLVMLGKKMLLGEYGMKRNEEKALSYIKQAIRSGSKEGIELMLEIRLEDRFEKQKLLKDIANLLEKNDIFDDKGNQLTLMGYMYAHGIGVNKNNKKAKELYEQAVELGNSEAMNSLGILYHKGIGVETDYKTAKKLYEQAKILGNSNAMVNLALLYEYQHNELEIKYLSAQNSSRKLYDEAIALENSQAMVIHGNVHFYGLNGIVMDNEAKKWYEKGAALGNKTAINQLGVMYYKGRGGGVDYGKAKELYEKAMILGETIAITNLGVLYYYGHGVEKNYSKARELCEEAADLGCGYGMNMLGVMYYNGHGLRKSYTEAKKLFEQAIELGNSDGLVNLGIMYKEGHGVNRNYAKAVELYGRGIELYNSDALYQLGLMYQYGYEVTISYLDAKELYEKAIKLGNIDAITNLGELYYCGYGVRKDYEKAKELYEKAINLGNSKAMNNLGVMYHDGYGVKQDYRKAIELYEEAIKLSNNTNTYALVNLGRMYESGHGVEKNYTKARELYEDVLKLSNNTNTHALVNLGRMYENGYGVVKNYEKAIKLYEKAQLLGNTDARRNLFYLKNKLEKK